MTSDYEDNIQIRPKKFSNETTEILGHWLADGMKVTKDMMTPNVINEMNVYRMIEGNDLYRGLGKHDIIIDDNETEYMICDFYTCFTYDPHVAYDFAASTDQIVGVSFRPEDTLIDTTLLDMNFIENKCGGYVEECVVIVKPGKYKVFSMREEFDA